MTETVRRAGLVLPRHCHQHTNMALVLQGSFIETIGRRPCEVGPGSLIIRPAAEPHANQYGPSEARWLVVEVKPLRLDQVRQISRLLESAAHFRGLWVRVLATRLAREFHVRDSASLLAIEALILELMVQASRQLPGVSLAEPRWLREAKDLIHEHFARPISLSSVAESVGVHPSHLATMFRRHYRSTVGEYVRGLRLDAAAEDLIQSDKSVAEIALSAGFYDQSHFCRAFRLYSGMNPSEFRTLATNARTKGRRTYKT